MADERDLTADELADELESIAGMIESRGPRGYDEKFTPTEAGTFRASAAAIRRLRAELDGGHKQMDRAGIPRDWGGGPLRLAQRIEHKLQALADMIEVRDDWVEQLRSRAAGLEAPATLPDCPDIVEAFAELAEAAGDANWDDLIAEKEAERQGRHELAAVMITRDDRILGFEDRAGCLEYLRVDPARVRVFWLHDACLAMAREWLEKPPRQAGARDAGRDGEGR